MLHKKLVKTETDSAYCSNEWGGGGESLRKKPLNVKALENVISYLIIILNQDSC